MTPWAAQFLEYVLMYWETWTTRVQESNYQEKMLPNKKSTKKVSSVKKTIQLYSNTAKTCIQQVLNKFEIPKKDLW